MPAEVVIYTTSRCYYCVRAKQLLAHKGVSFREVDLGSDPDTRQALRDLTGRRQVPQIFIDGKFLGGHYELVSMERSGELDALLAGESAGGAPGTGG
jgi:glutaredoxin 3